MKKLTTTLLTFLLLIPVAWARERAIKPVKATAAKQALLIGNANYAYAGRLRNPVNDAKAIGSTLEELGFNFTTVTDGDKRPMDQAIRNRPKITLIKCWNLIIDNLGIEHRTGRHQRNPA
jgi:hypothetical protein